MYCGFDFGTSNSTIGVMRDNVPHLIPLTNQRPQLRSAIFLNDYEKKIAYGADAVNEYLSHEEGRLLMSIKSVLGSSLMEQKTRVFNEMKPFTEVLGYFMGYMKSQCETYSNNKDIDSVVLGRPVHFNDRDEKKDKKAENTLRKIAQNIGFKNIEFQYEPIAAAKTFTRSNPVGKLAVIVDTGGGTSDFTIVRIGKESDGSINDILTTAGIHIGGTDIDTLISLDRIMPKLGMGTNMKSTTGKLLTVPSIIYHDLSTWHRIEKLYTPLAIRNVSNTYATAIEKGKIDRLVKVLKNKEGHRLLENCEHAKVELSELENSTIDLDFVEKNLESTIRRSELNALLDDKIDKILITLSTMNAEAGIKPQDIDTVFFTGGTSKIVRIQERILNMYNNAKVFNGDVFGSVGIGLTIDAQERFGS